MISTEILTKTCQKTALIVNRPVISLLLLVLIIFSNTVIAATVSAKLDRHSITLGETATLILDMSDAGNAQPDLSPLKQDFDIVNTGTSTQIQIINGHRSDSRKLNISIQPHHPGQIKVPAITVGNVKTSPLQLTVRDIPAVSQSKYGKSVWVEIDSPMKKSNMNVMVQQEIPVTVKLFTALPLSNISLTAPAPENTIVEKLGDDSQYNTKHNGKTFQVVEQHYVLFPEQAGDLTIPPVILRALTPDTQQRQQRFGSSVFNDPFNDPFFKNAFNGNSQIQQMLQRSNMLFGQSGKSITLRSNGLKFDVQHIPEVAKGKPWLPARNVTLSSSWQNNPPSLTSGEPVTLTVTVKADGLTGTQIPALALKDGTGKYSIYAEPAEMKSLTDGEHAIGISKQSFTIIPEQAGTVNFPEIKQLWWNTKTSKLQWAKLPALKLTVRQGITGSVKTPSTPLENNTLSEQANTTHSTTNQASGSAYNKAQLLQLITENKWLFAALLFILVLVSIVFFRFRTKHTRNKKIISSATAEQTQSTDNEQQRIDRQKLKLTLQEAITACETGDSQQTARSLLQWSKLAWPDIAPVSLLDIASNITEGAENIRQLHQHLYQPLEQNKDWNDPQLAELLRHGLKRKTTKHAKANIDTTLPPLYPA